VEYLLGQNDAVDMTSKTHGKKTFRYYVSQLLYLPVGLAGMLLAFFGGITAANYCHIHSEVVKGLFVFALFSIVDTWAGRVFGFLLERVGFLPRGAGCIYPQATSWYDYEAQVAERETVK
jgi:hypothetical protein